MKKQEYFDIGLTYHLTLPQIEHVLCQVLGIDKKTLFMMKDISPAHIYKVQKMYYEIQNGAPEEYTLQSANFYGRDFDVDERVLIPRNDTERLVSFALEKINILGNTRRFCYIDVGVGSGCIPITMIKELHPLKFDRSYALDISSEALKVAEKNAQKFNVSELRLVESDLLAAIFHEEYFFGRALCISANLPYIKNDDHENMDKSVIEHEPNTALYGGEKTGFELYETLIKQCFQMKQVHKIPEIHLFIEIGFDQRECSEAYLRELGLSFEYNYDSSEIARVIYITGF